MYVIYNPITKNMGDEKQKCAVCDKVKTVDELKQKHDGFNVVCKECSLKKKAIRDRRKESEGNKKDLPAAAAEEEDDDKDDEEEHLQKEFSILTLEQFINTLIATEDVLSLIEFVDLSELEGENEQEKAGKLAEAIWQQLKYRFM
jgi:hypothetical protein